MEKQWECNYCKQTLTIRNKQNISTHYIQCKIYKDVKDKTLTKDFLYYEYIILGKSAKQISDETSISTGAIIKYLKKHNIKSRNIKESHHMEKYKERIQSTNMRVYGAINPLSRGTSAFEKKNKTIQEKYGVDNVSYLPEVIEKIKLSLYNWRIENDTHSTKGLKHSNETKCKMRKTAINNIINRKGQIQPAYNIKSIPILEAIAKELGITDLQHAENGGEFYIEELGYFVDGYSKEKNIVIEYDESAHYDIFGNLRHRDVQRQKEIEEYLGCEFIRIKDEN